MLEKNLEDYKVVNSIGEELGKVKEAHIDIENWMIVAFEISPGAIKKNFILQVSEINSMDIEKSLIIVKDDLLREEVPKVPKKSMYPMDELKKLKVLDRSGEKIGKIYNFEVPYEKLKTFKIGKVLISTGLKERRLRIPPTEISEVMKEIKLLKNEEDYQGEKTK